MWELDHKEAWASKNWCCWTVVLEKTFESPLGCKEIQPVNPKGNQSWISIRRTDVEVEAPILWPPDMKSWLIRKDPNAGKDWGQEEKGMTEDEMVWWHHRLNGHELSQLREIMKDREAWGAIIHGVAKSWTWLKDWTGTSSDKLQKEENKLEPWFSTMFEHYNCPSMLLLKNDAWTPSFTNKSEYWCPLFNSVYVFQVIFISSWGQELLSQKLER